MSKLYLRKANKGDVLFILNLANDPECRKNSFNSEMISLDVHMKWFDRILSSNVDSFYILMDENIAIGQSRLELRDEKCRISYSIIQERRGCGYGKMLLCMLMKKALQDYPICKTFYAEVLPGNVASQKIFEALLFKRSQTESKDRCLLYEIDREGILNITDLESPKANRGNIATE